MELVQSIDKAGSRDFRDSREDYNYKTLRATKRFFLDPEGDYL